MVTPPYGWTIFCDDLRQEVGNKFSLMGIYKGDLLVHRPFPVTLAKLALAVSYRIHFDDNRLDDVEIFVFLPGDEKDKPSVKAIIPVSELVAKEDPPTRTGDAFREFHAHIVLSPLKLKEAGRIKVRARSGAGLIKLGSLRVEQFPSGTPQREA